MKNFIKGIIVGIGGIAPGLSGSVLLVILGLYQKTINSIATLFKNFKKNIIFLLPIILGFIVGIFLFSKVINFMLINFEMYTRFSFLGLILGTIPLFYKKVKKKGFNKKYFFLIIATTCIGLIIFKINKNIFPEVTNPNVCQCIILGVTIAGSSIVPGIDSAVILSYLGLYELYVSSLASLRLSVLIPTGIGVVLGVLIISFIINRLINNYYTLTFSIIFGLFLSIIPNILNSSCILSFNLNSIISIFILLISCMFSYFLGNIKVSIAKEPKYKSKKAIFVEKNRTKIIDIFWKKDYNNKR